MSTTQLFEQASKLDANDPFAKTRLLFDLPSGVVYLDGNSLGVLPKNVKPRMDEVIEQQWGRDLISSWNVHNWIGLPQQAANKIAPLLGVENHQVMVCDSISVNLFKALSIALTNNPERNVILSSNNNFPTDLYVAQGIEALLGTNKCTLKTVTMHDIQDHIDDSVAVVMLTQVDFRSGELLNIKDLTEHAHKRGALVLWDLAHSAGVVPLALNNWGVDLAVGCGYKYLNGGPGAPAFISLSDAMCNAPNQPIYGWMGHSSPFEFSPTYKGSPSAKQLLVGTPNILSLAALDAALDAYQGVDLNLLRQKSLSLSDFFITEFKRTKDQQANASALNELTLTGEFSHAERGSHVALEHPNAYGISQALIEANVVIDFRAPNLIRFGFAPLYNSHNDIAQCLTTLFKTMHSQVYLEDRFSQRKAVT